MGFSNGLWGTSQVQVKPGSGLGHLKTLPPVALYLQAGSINSTWIHQFINSSVGECYHDPGPSIAPLAGDQLLRNQLQIAVSSDCSRPTLTSSVFLMSFMDVS